MSQKNNGQDSSKTAFYDGLFKDALNSHFPQIVLLGAGYDTRALRFDHLNTGTRIIELDRRARFIIRESLFMRNDKR